MSRQVRWSLLFCIFAGCSTHPITDACDYFKPGKLGPNKVTPYGGVAIPQGPIVPVANVPVIGVPAFPGGGVIPPPAPLPGNRSPVELQPPLPGSFPPLPPNPPREIGQ